MKSNYEKCSVRVLASLSDTKDRALRLNTMPSLKKLSLIVMFLALFIVNPLYLGCGDNGEEDYYRFEAEEMRAVVVGTWDGTITHQGEEPVAFTLTLSQSTSATTQQGLEERRQGLCGDRSFIAPASACLATSTMPLDGVLTIGEQDYPISSTFTVYGAELQSGDLDIRTADRGYRFNLTFSDGALANMGSAYVPEQGSTAGVFSMQRR